MGNIRSGWRRELRAAHGVLFGGVGAKSKWTKPSLVTTALFSWTYGLAELQANGRDHHLVPLSITVKKVFLVSVSFRVYRNRGGKGGRHKPNPTHEQKK